MTACFSYENIFTKSQKFTFSLDKQKIHNTSIIITSYVYLLLDIIFVQILIQLKIQISLKWIKIQDTPIQRP